MVFNLLLKDQLSDLMNHQENFEAAVEALQQSLIWNKIIDIP